MCKKREVLGFIFLALVVFTVVCLLTYSPGDPGLHRFLTNGETGLEPLVNANIHNAFGLVGAYLASMFFMVLGIGALWVPLILLIAGLRLLRAKKEHAWLNTIVLCVGAFLLIICTSAIFSLFTSSVALFGQSFTTSGILGIWLKHFLVMFLNSVGAGFVLVVIWLLAFMMVTNVSFIKVLARLVLSLRFASNRFNLWRVKRRERRLKNERREQNMQVVQAQVEIKKPIQIQQPAPKKASSITPKPQQNNFEFMEPPTPGGPYKLPSISLLVEPPLSSNIVDEDNLRALSSILESKLNDFGVHGQVVAVYSGPVITTFEYEPAPGVKINKIVNLSDDLAMVLRAGSIRIVAPIPGKAAVGIEVPNLNRETVYFREIVGSDSFAKAKSPMTMCLGKDIVGGPVTVDLAKMPHLLIAGATGTGKSVGLNSMICSLLYKATPAEVQFIMIDPKRVELSTYDGIPHLVTPVVTDAKKATNALYWAVKEMESRYELLARFKVRNIGQFNQKVEKNEIPPELLEEGEKIKKLSFIVVIIDELADLMQVASKDVESALMRLAQMARACGIHLVLATQRPSVDVLTGIIKANFPTRLTFQVSSKTDSRTIIDSNGAENLLGNGDMLYLGPGTAKLARVHGAYLSDEELNNIIAYVKSQGEPDYIEDITSDKHNTGSGGEGDDDDTEYDEKYDEALALVVQKGQASASMIQRYLRIGYNRAQRIIEVMEQEGVVGPHKGASKPRDVLIEQIPQDK